MRVEGDRIIFDNLVESGRGYSRLDEDSGMHMPCPEFSSSNAPGSLRDAEDIHHVAAMGSSSGKTFRAFFGS